MLGYAKMWDQAVLDPVMLSHAKSRMVTAIAHQDDYKTVQAAVAVPITFLAPIHEREGSMRFNTHLHNGDPLSARTVHVPAGRPKQGNPPFKWSDSAIDALKLEKIDQVKNWSAERILYEQHKYNGITKHMSSYVFSGTQYYESGMWVRDHVFDENVKDTRPGTLLMAKALIALSPALGNLSREPVAPKEVVDEHKDNATKKSRVVRNAAGGATGATAGTEVAVKPKTTFQGVSVLQVGIGLCAAIFLVAAIYVVWKKAHAHEEINNLWSGT